MQCLENTLRPKYVTADYSVLGNNEIIPILDTGKTEARRGSGRRVTTGKGQLGAPSRGAIAIIIMSLSLRGNLIDDLVQREQILDTQAITL